MTDMKPVVLSEEEVREILPLADAIGVTQEALVAQAEGRVTQPAPWHLEIPEVRGEVHIKGAYVHGTTPYAAKLGTGFYGNRELAPSVLQTAGLVAADDIEQCRRVGELQYAADDVAVVALGDVLAGTEVGRVGGGQITVADLTGLGAEDAAVGTYVAASVS